MSIGLLLLQLGALVLTVIGVFVAEPIYQWLRARISPGNEQESAYEHLPWYWLRSVETGILEVAFAATATAMALPAFVPSGLNVHPVLIWIFQIVILASSSLAALASLWLYRIYVQQQACPRDESSPCPYLNPGSWWFWIQSAGPYSLLAVAIIFLLFGLGLLTLMAALSRT